MSSPGNSRSPRWTSSPTTVLSPTFTTTSQNSLPLRLHLLTLVSRPRPHLQYSMLIPKISAHQSGIRWSATTCRAPRPYFTRSRWPPSPSSKRRRRGMHHTRRPLSLAFPAPGMEKITRCMGSTPYQEYLFNSYISLIFRFFLAAIILMWTLLFARAPYGRLHVVLFSHCTPSPWVSRHPVVLWR